MRKNYKYLIVLFALALFSCSDKTGTGNVSGENTNNESILGKLLQTNAKTELDVPEYLAYCEDSENGLLQSKQIGDLIYTAFNKPAAYMILKEQNNGKLSADSFAKQQKEYGSLDYFSFRISSDTYNDELLKYKIKSENDYVARIEYFSFKMQNDFELVCGKDTIKPALFHYERVFGLAPHATLIMAFETNNYKGSKKIIYNDRVFNNGLIVLDYNETILKQIPKLKSYEK